MSAILIFLICLVGPLLWVGWSALLEIIGDLTDG